MEIKPDNFINKHLLKKQSEEYSKYHPKNTALTIMQIKDDEEHEIEKMNCVEHL